MRVGITERGDAGLDFSWINKVPNTLFSVLITKNLNDDFIKHVNLRRDKIIVHATITGYGGSKIEPNVPKPDWSLIQLGKLMDSGFPLNQIVLRVDPIFNSDKGVNTSIDIMLSGILIGIQRIRFSFIDTHYKHLHKRFADANIQVPPSKPTEQQINTLRAFIKKNPKTLFESCAEGFKIDRGCISEIDFTIMKIDPTTTAENEQGRTNCHCLACKQELFKERKPCKHGCLYCFWRG